MTLCKLTPMGRAATTDRYSGRYSDGGTGMGAIMARAALAMLGLMALSGCINIAAPEEPIVIELNVNIRAEVLYRLAEDASNTIDENADIF